MDLPLKQRKNNYTYKPVLVLVERRIVRYQF